VQSEKHEAGEARSTAADVDREFFFPEGLLGFGAPRYFTLTPYSPSDGSPSPFFVLQARDDDLCFPLISPALLTADYDPSPPSELLAKLGAAAPEELQTFAIVTLRDRVEEITVNLQAPVVLHPRSRVGFQIVAEQYPLRHPLLAPPRG
jgi:flagellar assembly factor FliW